MRRLIAAMSVAAVFSGVTLVKVELNGAPAAGMTPVGLPVAAGEAGPIRPFSTAGKAASRQARLNRRPDLSLEDGSAPELTVGLRPDLWNCQAELGVPMGGLGVAGADRSPTHANHGKRLLSQAMR